MATTLTVPPTTATTPVTRAASSPPPSPLPPSPTAHLPRWLVHAAEQPTFPWSTSAILLGALPLCVRAPVGFPQLIQLPVFAAIFGGSGYMIRAGDPVNGAGTTTAWSLVYLFFNGRKALQSQRPGPIALSTVVATQAATFGYYYFGQD